MLRSQEEVEDSEGPGIMENSSITRRAKTAVRAAVRGSCPKRKMCWKNI